MADIQAADEPASESSEESKSRGQHIVIASSSNSIRDEKNVGFTDVEAHIRFKDFKEKQVYFFFFFFFSPSSWSLAGGSAWRGRLTNMFFILSGVSWVDTSMVRNTLLRERRLLIWRLGLRISLWG